MAIHACSPSPSPSSIAIVAKVNQLMALCDRLAALSAADTARRYLLRGRLREALVPGEGALKAAE
jgi:hypothetical protein